MRRIDLTGHKFGRLTVIAFSHRIKTHYYYLCRCDCGQSKIVQRSHIYSGTTKSCGCHKLEITIERSTTHEMTKTVEYRCWANMKNRCINEKHPRYKDWGGRGITICERWTESFEAFYADMGNRPSPKHSIDRVNVDGNYEKENCRWATAFEQVHNRRKPFQTRGV